MTTRRGAIYCRISRTDPNIPKVETQEAMSRKLAASSDIKVVAVYVDDDISASRVGKREMAQRPGWLSMLDAIRAGELDVVLGQAEDRFTRELAEKLVMDDLCVEHGVTYLTQQDGATDPSKASGQLGSGIKALVARYYVATSSEKHRSSNEAARRRGEPARGGDVRPFGYEPDKLSLSKTVVAKVGEKEYTEPDLIREAYAGIIDGTLTPGKIAVRWNKLGVKTTRFSKVPKARRGTDGRHHDNRWYLLDDEGNKIAGTWDNTKVEALLRRHRNAGISTHHGAPVLGDDGRPVEAQWIPVVDRETFDAAISVLNDPSRRLTKVREPRYLCNSIATCGTCGTRLGATSNAKAKTYQCGTHRSGIKVGPTAGEDGTIIRHVSIATHVLDKVVTDAVVAAVHLSPTDAVPDSDTTRMIELRARQAQARQAEANLVELVSTATFNASLIAIKQRALARQIAEVDSELARIAKENAKAALLADMQHRLTQQTSLANAAETRAEIRSRFESMDLDQRRALVRGLLRVSVSAGGRGANRVEVTHLVATSLNEPYVDDDERAI